MCERLTFCWCVIKEYVLLCHTYTHLLALARLSSILHPHFFLKRLHTDPHTHKHLYTDPHTHTAVILQGVWPLTPGSNVWGFNHQAARSVNAEVAISASYWHKCRTLSTSWSAHGSVCVCVCDGSCHVWACFFGAALQVEHDREIVKDSSQTKRDYFTWVLFEIP